MQSSGLPYSGARLYFYSPGTTTPLNVYSDSALTTPIIQPVSADSKGQWVQIYMQPIPYRVQIKTSADVLIADYDNVDEGPGNTSGITAVASGGTGASTASGARTNLGLGALAVLNTVSTSTIDDSSITSAKIVDGTIATADIGALQVTLAKLATDAYTSGTWTPAVAFGGASVGVTYGTRAGNYIVVGKLCTVNFSITLTSKGSSVGNVSITGLPFTSANATAPNFGVGTVANQGGAGITGTTGFSISPNVAVAGLLGLTTGSAANVTDTQLSNTSVIQGSITYLTA
jgi:hypothetical protein